MRPSIMERTATNAEPYSFELDIITTTSIALGGEGVVTYGFI
jgi:hypothetical protein